ADARQANLGAEALAGQLFDGLRRLVVFLVAQLAFERKVAFLVARTRVVFDVDRPAQPIVDAHRDRPAEIKAFLRRPAHADGAALDELVAVGLDAAVDIPDAVAADAAREMPGLETGRRDIGFDGNEPAFVAAEHRDEVAFLVLAKRNFEIAFDF